MNREQILFEQERNETQDKVDYLRKRGSRLIIGGIILTAVILVITIFLAIYNTVIIYWYGGFIISISLIGKGVFDLRSRNELIFF